MFDILTICIDVDGSVQVNHRGKILIIDVPTDWDKTQECNHNHDLEMPVENILSSSLQTPGFIQF